MSKSKHWWGTNDDDDDDDNDNNDNGHDSETASKKSGKSGISRKSTAAFFYPPLTPPATSSGPSSSSKHATTATTTTTAAATASASAAREPVPPIPASVPGPPPLARHPYQAYYSPSSYDYHSSSTPRIITTSSRGNSRSQLPYGAANLNASTGTGTGGGGGNNNNNPLSTLSTTDGADGGDRSANKNERNNNVNVSVDNSRRDARTSSPLALSHSSLRIRRWIILLLLFLPLPPLLSLLYLAIGHSILRAAHPGHPSPSPWSSRSLLSSVNAGATGGIILALPLFLVFSLLFSNNSNSNSRLSNAFPTFFTSSSPGTARPEQQHTANENFFDDDDDDDHSSSNNSTTNIRRSVFDSLKPALGALLVLGMGSAAGAIGVACLEGSNSRSRQGGVTRLLLSPGDAAEAAIVGALVFWPGFAVVVLVGGVVVVGGGLGVWGWGLRKVGS